jgi:hypothetical protein
MEGTSAMGAAETTARATIVNKERIRAIFDNMKEMFYFVMKLPALEIWE